MCKPICMDYICAFSSFPNADSTEMTSGQIFSVPPPIQAQLYSYSSSERVAQSFPCRAQVLPLYFYPPKGHLPAVGLCLCKRAGNGKGWGAWIWSLGQCLLPPSAASALWQRHGDGQRNVPAAFPLRPAPSRRGERAYKAHPMCTAVRSPRVRGNALPSSGQKHRRAWDFLAAAEYFL